MIETRKDFERAIDKAMDRMEQGYRQRIASGELVGWVTCICGISIDARYLEHHYVASPLHICGV